MVQVRSLCIQLKELEEDKTRTETRLQSLQKNLGAVEEGEFQLPRHFIAVLVNIFVWQKGIAARGVGELTVRCIGLHSFEGIQD